MATGLTPDAVTAAVIAPAPERNFLLFTIMILSFCGGLLNPYSWEESILQG
jgi:hypothetical protein